MPRPPFDPVDFGRRLTREMKSASLHVQALQEAVRERTTARGTSYGQVWSYVNGKAGIEPRREVVEAMADVLGVLPAYLLNGSPPRTREEAAIQAARADQLEDEPQEVQRYRRIFRAMKAAEEKLPLLGGTFFAGRDELLEDLAFRLLSSGPESDYTDEEFAEAVFLLAWLILLPGNALDSIDFMNDEDRLEQYFLAICTALRIAMPRRDGLPLGTLARLRAAKEAWDARLPRRMSDREYDERAHDRNRRRTQNKDGGSP